MCLGVPGRIVECRSGEGLPMAVVDFGGARQEVCLACVPDARVGDWVLVHVGFALTVLDEQEAAATLDALESLGDPEQAVAP
ncbi:MAG: HypC/HybG/HupF family hydrogenase formation chaperone [Planctomycetes bacterium]|nr:HypC/HybG/HupF family hydrogenase formation chaperone [Planctomycetota bacterium]